MALAAGARLGPYEILSAIGAGGMGEVYRARDTKLCRDVALKVLSDSLVHDPDRLARFEREAHLLAALNHPSIGHIYGFEDSTAVPALVMELVDGDMLADRLAQGPMPLDDALPIARQISEALEAAHEQGIMHRDLKPANIKVRADGTVKVLDFGLAKAFDSGASSGSEATMSPTLSIHATQAGIILGTAAYMAPEQARGKAIDKRADIWAFGCVLFEMLTGRRAFAGDHISTTLAAVLKTEPEWSALPPTIPPTLRRLLSRCLQKDPRERLRDIGEARIAINRVLSRATEESAASASVRHASWWRHVVIPTATLLVGSVVTAAIISFAGRSTVARPRVSRFAVTALSNGAPTVNSLTRDVAVTPDGSRLIYVGANGTTLFVRPLDQLEATPLVRGVALRDPFVSPDGQWVGFFDGPQTLKKLPLTGGSALLVARLDSFELGATWATDGTIVFATAATTTGLQRVSADGGTPVVLTRPDRARGEASHRWPELLPGSQSVLYTVTATTSGLDAASIAVLDLRSGRSTTLLRGGSHAQYAPSGHLVFAAAGTLRAVEFDPRRGVVLGTANPVVPEVLTTPLGAADAVVARDGTLVWVDRMGRETPTGAPPRAYFFPRLSPHGTRVAMTVLDQKPDIWLWDLARGTLTRVTSDPGIDTTPVWTPDGRRMVFSSDRAGTMNLFSQAGGSSTVERLTESPNVQIGTAISPDGTQLVFTEMSPRTGQDVMALRLDGTHQVRPLVQTPFDERNGIVSPDGHWLAYEANDSGLFEVYVRPLSETNGGPWQVSTNGGTQPLWARNGHELFYLAPDGALMRVEVAGRPSWTAGAPIKVLEGQYVASTGGNFPKNYDIDADGRRFLMPKAVATSATGAPQIIVVQHFDEELKRLMPSR